MNIDPWHLRIGLAALAISSIVASQSAALAAPSSRIGNLPAFMTRAANDAHVPVAFVSDDNTNAVYLFDANTFSPQPLGKITDGIDMPTALAVDAAGDLYVANSNASHGTADVAVYRPGALHPFRMIRSDQGIPRVVAVGADGTLAIGYDPPLFTPGTLVVYDKGSLTPTRTISVPLNNEDVVTLIGLSIDASDNLALSVGRYPHGGQLLKFAPGSMQGVDVGIAPGSGGGFDALGNFYTSYGTLIGVFAPGATQPFRTISVGLTSSSLFAVTPDGAIYANNQARFDYGRNKVIPGDVVKYAPGGNRPIGKIKSSNDVAPMAVAIRPALP